MIFTDNQITDEKIKVRFYEWNDKERGFGDAGTRMIAIIPLTAFEEKKEERFEKGSFYYTYKINQEWYEKLGKTFGERLWHIDYGYQLFDEEKENNKRKELESLLSNMNKVRILN